LGAVSEKEAFVKVTLADSVSNGVPTV
jgi:hypothetical protein